MATIEKTTWLLNNKCRFVDWKHPNEGYDTFKEVGDLFISTAIDDIAAEYRGEYVEWLEIMENGPVVFPNNQDYRVIEITPTRHGPFTDPDMQLCYRLHTKLWQDEIATLPPEAEEFDYKAISLRFWDIIAECLTSERAYIALAKARTSHPMRLAAYAYDPAEGMHYLPNLVDPEFGRRYQEYLKKNAELYGNGN
jgi:hypothetical protein